MKKTPRQKIPAPPHPLHRQRKLPWQTPKPSEEDEAAPVRIEALLHSESYRQADEDIAFLVCRKCAGNLGRNSLLA